MLEIFSIFLTLVLVSKLLETKTNIPFILTIIVLTYIVKSFFDLSILKDNFHEIVYLMLPSILIPDVLGLSTDELKENKNSIFFLAVVAVVISIVLAVGFTYKIDYFHGINIYFLLLLFTPLMATDVVSVGAIFSKFKIPHKLKLYAEGESLFNDITAMVIFFFIAIPLSKGNDVSVSSLATLTLSTIAFSILLGVVFGFIGYLSFSKSNENFIQFISVYLMASLAFLVADRSELSGILAVVVAVIFFKYLFNKEGNYKKKNLAAVLLHLNATKNSINIPIRAYKKEAQTIGFLANAVIFISIATVIDLDILWKYKYDIAYVFTLTTIVRYVVLYFFTTYKKDPLRWLNILTLAGMKGGLALIMIVSLSDDFIYKEQFSAITLGVVILSIFIYTVALMLYLFLQKDALKIDMANEYHLDIKDVKDLLKKESQTGAYNQIIFEDFLEKEIYEAQRFQQTFVMVAFESDIDTINAVKKIIRKSDIFGKIDTKHYAILLPQTSLDDVVEYLKKLQKYLEQKNFSITQYSAGDTKESLYEKLLSGFEHTKNIAIEV